MSVARYRVTLLRVGTFRGSAGDLHYSAGALARSVPGWVGKPVCYGHPRLATGDQVSINASAAIYKQFAVGMLDEVAFDGTALRGTAVVDRLALARRDPVLLGELDAGRVRSVSTGVYYGPDGEFTPDHLALLPPGTPGACDLEQGCSVGGAA
jgi:hypothetical protein